MRGPGYKLSGDVRRTWRCPHCGRERKRQGDVTSISCGCQSGAWMQIVVERNMVPRPLQRPSDIERRPIDFGIEPTPAAPAKPEATIIKPAISREPDPIADTTEIQPAIDAPVASEDHPKDDQDLPPVDDDWGEGIL